MQSNKKPWTEHLGDLLKKAFPMEVLNSLTDMDWSFFSYLMNNSPYDAATYFRNSIDNFFAKIVLSGRISPETKAKIPLTPELLQNFRQSCSILYPETAPPPVIQNPIPQPQTYQAAPIISHTPTRSLPPGYDQFPVSMERQERLKFLKMGIQFNDKGQVTSNPPLYTVQQEHSGDNWHVTIVQGTQKIVRVNTRTSDYQWYSHVFWENIE